MQSKSSELVDNYLKLTKKNAWNKQKEKLSQNVSLLDLKMIDYITDAKNVK